MPTRSEELMELRNKHVPQGVANLSPAFISSARGAIMIDVEGGVTGQVNGLSVYSMGDIMFGRPSRITAQTFLGRRGVINIERESELSGPIHNKGVLILSGYLG